MAEWHSDPAKWRARPLHERLERLRIYHCTGPCGQGQAVQTTRSELDRALKEARDLANGVRAAMGGEAITKDD